MKDRIRQLMEDLHLTQQNFAQQIGTSNATLSNIFTGKTNPSLAIVDGIHVNFPQVRLEWLLDGTPPMYNNKVEGQGAGVSSGTEGESGNLGEVAVSAGAAHAVGGMNQTGGGLTEASLDFDAGDGVSSPTSPSLFTQPQVRGVNSTPKNIAQAAVKYVDKQQRKITEIRIFYDDQTWETFVPKK